MKKALLFLVILSLISINANSQDSFTDVNSKYYKQRHQIGLAAGFTTGYGISYRYWPKLTGVQITLAPYISENEALTSFGVTLLHTIIESKYTRLFGYFGNHLFYQKTEDYSSYAYYDYDNDYYVYPETSSPTYTTQTNINNGLGLGFEFTIAKHLGLNIMAGYASYYYIQEKQETITMTIEGGIYYKFSKSNK